MSRKFPEWELHPQNQGANSSLTGGEGGRKSQVHKGRVGYSWPRALPMGCGVLHLKGARGTLAPDCPCAPEKNTSCSLNTMCCCV